MATNIAEAFLKYGSIDCWPPKNGGPITGIGITLGHGSWPVYQAPAKPKAWRLFWRNPDGDLWDQPGRFGTIESWFPKMTGMWWVDFPKTMTALRSPLVVPWDPAWTEVGGTQSASADNGIIIELPDGTAYELQGMAKLNVATAAHVNARTFFSGAPTAEHYRIDGVFFRNGRNKPQGSQGPWSKSDGLMRPNWLRGPWPGPVRLVGYNVQFGPTATAVKGARVEHPKAEQPYRNHPVTLPMGNDPRMIPCGQLFKLDITDAEIEKWLDVEKVPPNSQLRVSKRWFAIGLRDHGMRLSETGTGFPILESSGGANPVEKAEWAKYGVNTEADANRLGAGVFAHGRLVAA